LSNPSWQRLQLLQPLQLQRRPCQLLLLPLLLRWRCRLPLLLLLPQWRTRLERQHALDVCHTVRPAGVAGL
jgi:hypothetical protein